MRFQTLLPLTLRPAVLFGVCLLVLLGLVGCGDQRDTAQLDELRTELAQLEKRIAEERVLVDEAEERFEEAERNAGVVRDLQGGFRAKLQWSGSTPILTGTLRNDSEQPISAVRVEITLNRGADVVSREQVTIAFDPILLPGGEEPVAAEASPYTWGFQERQPDGYYRFIVEEATLASGRTLRDDFSAGESRRTELARQRQKLTDLRLEHGVVYMEVSRLEKSAEVE